MSAADRLAELSPDARAAALAVLDEISRPMKPWEIEDALIGVLPRRLRKSLTFALKEVSIIIIIDDRLTGESVRRIWRA